MAEEKKPFAWDAWPAAAEPPRERRRSSFFEKKRTWLNVLLFVLTALSTFFVGITWSLSFKYADRIGEGTLPELSSRIFKNPQIITLSLIYAAVLLGILTGHELGHYLACRFYRISATLPFFIPAPTLIGTMGAFIKIKSPITKKKQLFDVGVAGPLTSFLLALPALICGLSLSKIVPSLPREEAIVFGEPLLLKIIGGLMFPHLPEGVDIILHPVAFAGWVGILVTAFNLFPLGQLDGGHIIYALFGPRSQSLSRYVLGLFLIMGIFFWLGWLVWALLILILGLKHPRISDEDVPLSTSRRIVGFIVIIVFILSFIPDPIKGYNVFDLLAQF
jgi:membrane-associated protease RseP (regulator of RpoE activity)